MSTPASTTSACLLLWLALLPTPPAGADEAPLFVESAAQAGFRHVHVKPLLDPKLAPIMPWMTALGAAACTADYNRDGKLDLFATNSRQGEPNFLYRNNGDGTFSEVGAAAGVASLNDDGGVGMDCVWGDVENDGWPDLFVARWGRSLLLHNRGDGSFENVTDRRFHRADGSPGMDWKNTNAAIFFDVDRDGRLDLYLGNYFRDDDLWHLTTTRIMHESFEHARNAGLNQLYHQSSDGSFTEIAAQLGLADPGWTLAVGSADLDEDGWPDLYLANDFGPDRVFLNRGGKRFVDVSEQAIGVDTKKGMNVDFGDFDNDGRLDIFVTNITSSRYLREGNMLWHNQGVGEDGIPRFADVAAETGTFDAGWGWGAKFFDADNDGDLDLVAADGFVTAGEGDYWLRLGKWRSGPHDPLDALAWPPLENMSFSGSEPLRFFRNDAVGTFSERARETGLVSTRDNRGVVAFDADDDGDLDLYVANQGQPADFFRNQGSPGHHWLVVELVGDPAAGTTRDAVGALVSIETAAGRQLRLRDGGSSFCGQSDPRLHFGLGSAATIDSLEVRWPGGGAQTLEKVAADQHLTIRQSVAAH